MKSKKKRGNIVKKKKWIFVISVLVIGLAIGGVRYLNSSYVAQQEAYDSLSSTIEGISIEYDRQDEIVYAPQDASVGLIFYPGGKVDFEAYAPLMEAFAREGIMSVVVHMPANLAIFDMDAAEDIRNDYPQIEKWYIGGHSLGGAMAASYLEDCEEHYEGLLLLAAYSTVDYSNSELEVLSVYGTNDGVMNREKYEEYQKNLPQTAQEYVIEGGNHANFGYYGHQEGDEQATISREEQIVKTVEQFVEMTR